MFVQNKTPLRARLTRGRLVENRSIGTIVVDVAYSYSPGALALCEELPPRCATDPPDLADYALWRGTSVTAAGDIRAARVGASHQLVTLTVGAVARRLAVFGARRWVRDRGGLRASMPEPFDRLSLSFKRAFGGYFDVDPGLFPESDLPFVGGRIGFSLNEQGIGFYRDECSAEGHPLPNFELADQLIRKWSDRPMPGCFVPCQSLRGLRSQPPGIEPEDTSREGQLLTLLFGLHHAPGYLVFGDLPPRTPIVVDGIGQDAIRFEVPSPSAQVRVRFDTSKSTPAPKLRSVHVDIDRGLVTLAWGYSFLYDEGKAPSWIFVEAR